MKDQYVILTGSKNNAGDYLIKFRARQLFAAIRPDREIIDLDAWKPLTAEQLETVNQSRALILMGGPSLQYNMRPGVYPLVDDLSAIKVPVIMMGSGYKDAEGSWRNISNYKVSPQSLELLKKVDNSGYQSGVRDYHTLQFLHNAGCRNFIMTGCPALFDPNHIGKTPQYPSAIKKIAFSLGVSYLQSEGMDKLMKDTIAQLAAHYKDATVTVYFHHTIKTDVPKQKAMVDWLSAKGIAYEDISGSDEKLRQVYGDADLHVGFRVHSHIYACSVSKPSVLYAEDGRGKGLKTVISGLIFDAFYPPVLKFGERMKFRLGMLVPDSFDPYTDLGKETCQNIDYELRNNFPRMQQTRACIDSHYEQMKKYLLQLP